MKTINYKGSTSSSGKFSGEKISGAKTGSGFFFQPKAKEKPFFSPAHFAPNGLSNTMPYGKQKASLDSTVQTKAPLNVVQLQGNQPSPSKRKKKPPIAVKWTANMPTVPKPSYAKTINSLGAWERANLILSPAFSPVVESSNPGKDNASYLKSLDIDIKPTYEYFIGRELMELAKDGYLLSNSSAINIPKDADFRSMRICFKKVLFRVRKHAVQHFHIYDAKVKAFEKDFMTAVQGLPSSKNPYPMKKADMEKHVADFVGYHMDLLKRRLWQATCNWEKKDYPDLLKKTCVSGQIKVACGPKPTVRKAPPLLITVKTRP